MAALSDLLDRHALEGVWMDYLHWLGRFEDAYPVVIKTYFCERYLDTFQQTFDIEVPDGSVPDRSKGIFMNVARVWEDWRVSVIVDWTQELRSIIKGRPSEAAVFGERIVALQTVFQRGRGGCGGRAMDAPGM